jgi:hypothetical protein
MQNQTNVTGGFDATVCSTAIKHSKVDVRVIGDHPHSGKSGWIPLRNGEPETINMFGRLMAKIEFPDGTGCYAEMRHFSIYKDQRK